MFEQYYHLDQCAGVSIFLKPDEAVDISICSVSKKNKELNLNGEKTEISKITNLSNYLVSNTTIALNLCGKGILTRQMQKEEVIDKQAFQKVLVNAELNDFYVQNFISGEYSYVSAIRKTDADQWLRQLINMGFKVLALSLGPFPVENIVNQLNFYGEGIIFNGHSVFRDDDCYWISCGYNESQKAQFPIKIGINSIEEQYILPYACAFQLILAKKITAIAAVVPELNNLYSGTIQKRKIRVVSFALLGVFFISLLINYAVLTYLNSENTRLAAAMAITSDNAEEFVVNNEKIIAKEALLKQLDWDGGINKAVRIDQIAALLPPEVTLTEISINPVDLQQSRLEKTIVFKSRHLHIVGKCQRIVPVNEWIERIKTKLWVKDIQLDRFLYDIEESNGFFAIEIDY